MIILLGLVYCDIYYLYFNVGMGYCFFCSEGILNCFGLIYWNGKINVSGIGLDGGVNVNYFFLGIE